jgi:hypothetical protein
VLVCITLLASTERGFAADRIHEGSAPLSELSRLAASKFPNLTHAELALLEFVDIGNLNHGEFAVAGPSPNPLDPSNDPKDAATWTRDRDIRATLIEWLTVDRAAIARIHPSGIRVLGTRVVGSLDLSYVRVPFGIMMIRCSIPEQIRLQATEIPRLDLSGSYTGEIFANDIRVESSLAFGYDGHEYGSFHANGEVDVDGGKIGGNLSFAGGHFQHSKAGFNPFLTPLNVAIDASDVEVKHGIGMCCGFESDGAVNLNESIIGGDLTFAGGRFVNPNSIAITASVVRIGGSVFLALEPFGPFYSDGAVEFVATHVEGVFSISSGKFAGKATERHGLFADLLEVDGAFGWQKVDLENGATLDLTDASVIGLGDDQRSWPQPGKLLIDGFTYKSFGVVKDAPSRLRWVALQPEFHPQPYRQLAKVLRANGDDAGAVRVLIAEQDARFQNSPLIRRVWAAFLKTTVGYGHEPLLTIIWAAIVVLLGWLMVTVGSQAGVMRRTWPESTPISENVSSYERLDPLLYSLDVFLPFVNLHQEHYWWPDADATGDWTIFGLRLKISGGMLRCYFWMQIIAGWLLSAIFLAGVTGLIRTFED